MKKESKNITPASITPSTNPIELNDKLIQLLKKSGDDYFKSLVKFLCEITNTNFCLIGKYNSDTNTIITQSFIAKNEYVDDFEYDPQNGPCKNFIDNKICFHPKNVQQLFPDDEISWSYRLSLRG